MEIVIRSATDISVRSESDPSVWYDVNGVIGSCTCLGYLHRGGCKHLKEVAKALKQHGIVTDRPQPPPREDPGRGPKERLTIKDCPQLYTSRYQNQNVLGSGSVIPVCTSLGKPRFPLRYSLEAEIGALKPARYLMKKDVTWEEYVPAYIKMLEGHGVEKLLRIFRQVSKMSGGKPLALLCYEDLLKGTRCHRRLFAQWWERKTGMQVPELMPDGDCRKTDDLPKQFPEQDTLL